MSLKDKGTITVKTKSANILRGTNFRRKGQKKQSVFKSRGARQEEAKEVITQKQQSKIPKPITQYVVDTGSETKLLSPVASLGIKESAYIKPPLTSSQTVVVPNPNTTNPNDVTPTMTATMRAGDNDTLQKTRTLEKTAKDPAVRLMSAGASMFLETVRPLEKWISNTPQSAYLRGKAVYDFPKSDTGILLSTDPLSSYEKKVVIEKGVKNLGSVGEGFRANPERAGISVALMVGSGALAGGFRAKNFVNTFTSDVLVPPKPFSLPKAPPLPSLKGLGKTGAVFKGGRRVSPLSKASQRKASYGYEPKRLKGVSYSQNEGLGIARVRDPKVKAFYGEQIGLKVKEIRYKQDSLTLKNPRVEVVIRRDGIKDFMKGFKVVDKKPIPKPKALKPSKPYKYTTSEVTVGDQKLLTKKLIRVKNEPTGQKLVSPRLNDQKQFLRGDPARSSYSAQNILRDPQKVDLGTIPPAQTTNLRGFRKGFSPQTVLSKRGEQISFLKSDLRDLLGAELPPTNVATVKPPLRLVTTKPPLLAYRSPSASVLTVKKEKSVLGVKEKENVIQKPMVAIKPTLNVKQKTYTSIKSEIKPSIKTKTKTKITTTPIITPKKPITPEDDDFKPLPPIITSKPLPTPKPPKKVLDKPLRPKPKTKIIPPLKRLKSRNNRKTKPAYDVYVRKKGVFRLIGTGLTKSSGFFLGSKTVGTTASATFKLKRVGTTTDKAGPGFINRKDFTKKDDLYIEKRERRIKSSGELKEITYKGLQSLRNDRGKKRGVFVASSKTKPLFSPAKKGFFR